MRPTRLLTTVFSQPHQDKTCHACPSPFRKNQLPQKRTEHLLQHKKLLQAEFAPRDVLVEYI
ncbi:MAG: hypothetical protein CMM01_10545 [Rhodopirellula sp.]|nr:hypothetical protein [Rhodopirellula sp.]